MQIADYQATETAMDKVRALLDARQPAEAIAFADACEGDQPLVTQVRALACTHGGTMLRDRELIERGAWLWMQAGADKHPGLGYNLSNAHLDLWDLAGVCLAAEQRCALSVSGRSNRALLVGG